MKQKTIKKECAFSGIGLHNGRNVEVKCFPADESSGINFIRVDLSDQPKIKVDPLSIHIDTSKPRCTAIGKGEESICTVEHFMSVLCGLGITNLRVEINANELPGLDGSGIDFLKGFKKTGIVEQDSDSPFFEIKEPIGVELNGCSIFMVPAQDFKISYTLNYDHPILRSQFFSVTIDDQTYEREIAPCRTFCLEEEADELRARGLGQGANYDNTLVVGKKGVIKNKVRFPDEFARHKVLDFIGDLYLMGMPIRGHVFAVKSGHTLNIELLKKIIKQREKYEKRSNVSFSIAEGQKEISNADIMKILPHRYPFLLVDKVINIEKGKRGTGIKNVTGNESFFQGHFPSRPIMPGVLMLEAMAQTAGIVILTNELHHGKLAIFMAADNVKFRKLVVPGDQLLMEVEIIRDGSRIAQVHAVSKVNEEVVVEADIIFSYTDASFLDS